MRSRKEKTDKITAEIISKEASLTIIRAESTMTTETKGSRDDLVN